MVDQDVLNIVTDVLGTSVVPEDNLKSLGIDSIEMIEILNEVEEKFRIEVSDTDMENILTVRDLIDCVKKKVN